MRITLKDALRSLISCENKYGRRSMMLTWGGAVALFHVVRQRGENGAQNIHAARLYLSNNGVAFEMGLLKAPVCSFYE